MKDEDALEVKVEVCTGKGLKVSCHLNVNGINCQQKASTCDVYVCACMHVCVRMCVCEREGGREGEERERDEDRDDDDGHFYSARFR